MFILILNKDKDYKMPTEFTDCDECNNFDWLDINHKFNIRHKRDLEVNSTLLQKGFPEHVCRQIIKYSHTLMVCSHCRINFKYNKPIKLCKHHYERAKKNGTIYNKKSPICDRCCWQEVS